MPDHGRPYERASGSADLDDVWSELTILTEQNKQIIALLTRIADAVDPPEPEPDRTSLYTETVLRVPKRRRPPLRGQG